jgi:DNA polymerase I-like protein with 3'-5' exonuclease and polymerase domains
MFEDSFGLSKTEKKPYDIHILKATEVFGVGWDCVTKEQRDAGKTIRHARNYEAGPTVLANRLGISMSAAKEFIKIDRMIDPSLDMWHLNIQAELKRSRTLVNLLGRKHRFLDRWGDTLFRSAYSYIPQSTVGDLLNTALKKVYDSIEELYLKNLMDLDIIFQLHDAVYVLAKEEDVEDMIKHIRKQMLIPLTYNNETFTIDVDFAVGDSWGETVEQEINWRN